LRFFLLMIVPWTPSLGTTAQERNAGRCNRAGASGLRFARSDTDCNRIDRVRRLCNDTVQCQAGPWQNGSRRQRRQRWPAAIQAPGPIDKR
jgi:hypothetical protein